MAIFEVILTPEKYIDFTDMCVLSETLRNLIVSVKNVLLLSDMQKVHGFLPLSSQCHCKDQVWGNWKGFVQYTGIKALVAGCSSQVLQ